MDLSNLVSILLYLLVVGVVCSLLWWLIGFASGKGVLASPFVGVAQVIVAVIAVVLLINLLLGLGGGQPFLRYR